MIKEDEPVEIAGNRLVWRHIVSQKSMMQKEDNMTEEERIKKEMDNIPYKVVVEPAPCSRTALVRDRFIDEIKAEMKEESSEKVDDATWDKVVKRMREKEKKRRENDK